LFEPTENGCSKQGLSKTNTSPLLQKYSHLAEYYQSFSKNFHFIDGKQQFKDCFKNMCCLKERYLLLMAGIFCFGNALTLF
jgi:hypothetical protein